MRDAYVRVRWRDTETFSKHLLVHIFERRLQVLVLLSRLVVAAPVVGEPVHVEVERAHRRLALLDLLPEQQLHQL